MAETYGVLENLDQAGDFVARVAETESVKTAFIVTDDDSAFQMVCRDLPSAGAPGAAVRVVLAELHAEGWSLMRYTLKDYQGEAVRDVLRNLEQARDMYHRYGSLSQFSLTATTGAGKTVMAAAVIEALFFGNDEFDFDADPGAVVLWFSDDPSLNEQSRARLQEAASELDSRLRVIETTFSEPSLRPGHVYFLNTQKLSKNSRLVRGEPTPLPGQERLFQPRPDEMQSSIYDVITNTVENKDLTLYFVLDEAHRGMGTTSKDRTTIVQRLINGHGAVPPMPVVFGISATVERFEAAMKDAKGRTALPSVEVDSALVQASGC